VGLLQTVDQDSCLNHWPVALYAFNPRLTANFKKIYVDLDHADQIDALVAADRLRLDRDLPPPFHCEDRYLPVHFLTRYHLMHALTREEVAPDRYDRPGQGRLTIPAATHVYAPAPVPS
jgi:hypothetical protein